MKKIYFALAAVAAVLAGCSKEVDNLKPEPITPGEKAVSLKASVGDPQTKVSSDNAGIFNWQDSDKITVLTNNGNVRQFTIGEITDGTSAEFSGTIPDAEGETIKYALYPASASHFTYGNDKIRFHIDDQVIWDADASNMPMRAKVDGSASFKAVGGVLKLILFNIPAKADYLKFSATNKQISGDFVIADASITAPVIATAAKEGDNNEQVIDFSANYSLSKVFYIPLPTGTIDGFTVALYETLEAEPLYTVTSTKSLSVTANKLIIAPVMNCGPAATDDVVTNDEIKSKVSGSYPGESSSDTYSLTSTEGNIWEVNACKQSDRMQLRNTKGSHIKLPVYDNQIASIILEGVYNAGVDAYTGTLTLSSAYSGGTPIATVTPSVSAGENVTITVPSGYYTGYLLTSAGIRITSITVKFRGGYSAPVITTEANELIFKAGQISKNVAVSLVNAIDELGIGALVGGTNKDNFKAAIEGNTLTVTALAQNPTTANYTATITLRASGATAKTIAITQESSLTPTANPSISCSSNTITIDCETAGATIYYTIGADAEHTPDPTNASDVYDAENKPTIDTDSYVKAYAIADGYPASSIVGQAVSYVAPGTDTYYVKVTSAPSDWSGDYILVCENQNVALSSISTTATKYGIGSSVKISESKILSNSTTDPYKIVIAAATGGGSGYTLKFGDNYLYWSSGNSLATSASETNNSRWAIAAGATSGNWIIANVNDSSREIWYNTGSPRFACYTGKKESDNGYAPVQLYKLDDNDTRQEAGMSWSAEEATATYSTGNSLSFSAPTLTPGYATDITYESTDGAIATVAADGTVTITALSGNVVTEGSTTIKAIFAGNDDYKPQTVSYTLTVEDSREAVAAPVFDPAAGNYTSAQNVTISCTTEDATIHYTTDGSAPTTASSVYSSAIPVSSTATIKAIAVKTGYKDSSVESALYTFGNDGSLEHPYTATDVLGITSAIGVYVTGTISAVTEVNTTYHNATYNITDGESTILVFRGKFVNNTDFTSGDQITENDQVIVFGDIGQYQSISQLSQGNYIYSLNGITKALTAGTLSTSVNNDNKQITVTWGAASGSTETITYVVTCGSQTLSPNPTAAGSHTFTMADYGSYSVSVVASADDAVSATASTTATLTDPGSTAKWNRVSTLSGIKNGTYAIAALNSSKYYTVPNTTISAQTFTCLESSYSAADGLTPATGSGEFVFTAVSGISNAFYIYNTNLKKYLVATGSKTFGYVDSTSGDYGYWTFSTVSSGGFSGQFSVQHSNKTHYMRAYNNSVRCYDGASNNGVYLFIYE